MTTNSLTNEPKRKEKNNKNKKYANNQNRNRIREMDITGRPIRLSADFLKETIKARRVWKEVFQVLKGKDVHPRLLYPAKLSFRMEGQMKCFSDKVKLKEFIITKPLLCEMLKGFI